MPAVVQTSQHQLAAVSSQKAKADVPWFINLAIGGTVGVRPRARGEVVQAGQTLITLINPTIWVRADIEETYRSRQERRR